MDPFVVKLVNQLKKQNGGHVFYHYRSTERYLEKAITFIVTAIKTGDHVFFIENDRNSFYIVNKLEKQLDKQQMKKLHLINNFNFYYANGNFQIDKILRHITVHIKPVLEHGASICAWGLVEWRDDEEVTKRIMLYEKEIGQLINENKVICICAYDASKTPPSLTRLLLDAHEILLTDNEITYLT